MEDQERSRIISKMIGVAFKERFAHLAKKYDSQTSLRLWNREMEEGEFRTIFDEKRWRVRSLERLLDSVDDYVSCLESSIRRNAPKEFPRQSKTGFPSRRIGI